MVYRRTKARISALLAYRREYNRIRREVSKLEKQGYTVPEEYKPSKPSSLSTWELKTATKRLSEVRTRKVISSATRITESGEVETARQARQRTAKQAARKASETRKRRYGTSKVGVYISPERKQIALEREEEYNERQRQQREDEHKENEWERERREQDERDRERITETPLGLSPYDIGNQTYQKIISMIDATIRIGYGWGGKYLRKLLDEQIAQYGEEAVITSIGNTPSMALEQAEKITQTKYKADVEEGIRVMTEIITGEKITPQQTSEISDIKERDEGYSDIED